MWVIFKPPSDPVDFSLLALHTESFVELALVKLDTNFRVVIQKPFDTDNERLEFALDMIDALKDGKPTFELPQHFPSNPDDKKNKIDKAYL